MATTNEMARKTERETRCSCGAFALDHWLPQATDASGGIHRSFRCPAYAESMTPDVALIFVAKR